MDLFLAGDGRNSFQASSNFFERSQQAIDHSQPLHLFFDKYFLNHRDEALAANSMGLKLRLCDAQRGYADSRRVLNYQLDQAIESYQEHRQAYLSGLRTMIDLLKQQMSLRPLPQSTAIEIVKDKIKQLEREYHYIYKLEPPSPFTAWKNAVNKNFIAPLTGYFQQKQFLQQKGYPQPAASPTPATLQQQFDSLGFCQ